MSRNEVRVSRCNLDESDESNISNCFSTSMSNLQEKMGGRRRLTILIDVLEETSQFLDTSCRENFPFSTVQHSSHDRSLDALVEQRHSWSSFDEIGKGRNELLDQSRFFRSEDSKLAKQDSFDFDSTRRWLKMSLTSLIILINIQLFVPPVNNPNNSGASERYRFGSFLAASQTTLTVAPTTPISSSASLSLRRSTQGSSPLSSRPEESSLTPGQLFSILHRSKTVCLRTIGRECDSSDKISGARSRARGGVRRRETEERVEVR